MMEKVQKSKGNRIVFVGCVKEGKDFLNEIIHCDGHVVAILTFTREIAQKTSGAVSFDDISIKHNIPLFRIKSTNDQEAIELLKKLNPDTIFVIGWTRLLSRQVLEIPHRGCIGLHASALPKYRGRAPVNWAIINGETRTGNTMMILDEGVDTGDIIAQRHFGISFSDTCETLYEKVSAAGVEMLHEILPKLETGALERIKQKEKDAPPMPKRKPEDGLIDWNGTGYEIFNWIRALTAPYPGAFTYYKDEQLMIWEARLLHYRPLKEEDWYSQGTPGTIVDFDDGIIVKTGNNDIVSLHRLGFRGNPRMNWREFVTLYNMKKCERFSSFPVDHPEMADAEKENSLYH